MSFQIFYLKALMSNSDTCSEVFESNKNVAIAALRTAGVTLVTATYVGGDCGKVSSVKCSNDDGEIDVSAIAVSYQLAEQTFDSAVWSFVVKEKSGSLEDLISQLTIDTKSIQDSFFAVQSKYNNETNDWDGVVEQSIKKLDSLASESRGHCLTVLGHDGYQNGGGGGGGGIFTIDVQTGVTQMEHYENTVQQEYFNFSIDPQTSEILHNAFEEDTETAPAAPSA